MSTQDNKTVGTQVEEYRAKERNGERTPEAWFDVEDGDGTLVEVKSCDRRVAVTYGDNDHTRPGRYQIDEDNHYNLLDHGGVYDFVLKDGDGTAAERTMTAREVEDLREEKGLQWPESGKLKLLWKYVHPEVAE